MNFVIYCFCGIIFLFLYHITSPQKTSITTPKFSVGDCTLPTHSEHIPEDKEEWDVEPSYNEIVKNSALKILRVGKKHYLVHYLYWDYYATEKVEPSFGTNEYIDVIDRNNIKIDCLKE